MKYFKIFLTILFLFNIGTYSLASEIYFIDMKKILNHSKAGKGAQEYLKKKLKEETKKFDKEQAALKKEETNLISQKKIITPEEYKKKLNVLREKNITHQKNRQLAANEIFKKKEITSKEIGYCIPWRFTCRLNHWLRIGYTGLRYSCS